MAIAKLDFNRGQVVNPLSAFGDDLTKSGQIFRQQELDKANLERQANADRRAQEMLSMEKQKYADQLASREAANKYYSQLTGALAPGNIGVQDQATLGTQIAGLGQQAQTAYEQGNKAIGDQLVAQQQSLVSGQLPGMQQAYQTSPQAKVDLLNTLTAPTNMDVRDRLGILKDVTAPMDKAIDREQTIEGQKALEKMRGENDQKIWEKRFGIEQAKLDAREKRQEALLKSKEDLLEKRYDLLEKVQERKEVQKIKDDVNTEIEAMNAKIKTMDPKAEETIALETQLKKGLAYLEDDKYPLQAKQHLVKDLAATFKTTEERGYKEHEKEKEKDIQRMTAVKNMFSDNWFGYGSAEMGDLRGALTEGLKSDKDRQALQDKYGTENTDAATLVKDLYNDKKLKAELDSILLSTNANDAVFGKGNKEDQLKELLKRQDVRESLLGRELTKIPSNKRKVVEDNVYNNYTPMMH